MIPWCFNDQDDAETFFTTEGGFCQVEIDFREEYGYFGINKEEIEKRVVTGKFDKDDSITPGCYYRIIFELNMPDIKKALEKK